MDTRRGSEAVEGQDGPTSGPTATGEADGGKSGEVREDGVLKGVDAGDDEGVVAGSGEGVTGEQGRGRHVDDVATVQAGGEVDDDVVVGRGGDGVVSTAAIDRGDAGEGSG